jgi:hypothetical protein
MQQSLAVVVQKSTEYLLVDHCTSAQFANRIQLRVHLIGTAHLEPSVSQQTESSINIEVNSRLTRLTPSSINHNNHAITNRQVRCGQDPFLPWRLRRLNAPEQH